MSEAVTEQQEMADLIEELEAGMYVREDNRVEPLRVCEQQPHPFHTVATVSTQGTVYLLRAESNEIRKYRGTSVQNEPSDMASDGAVQSITVAHEKPEPRLRIQPDEFQFVQSFPRPRVALIEGFSVGRFVSTWRRDYEWAFDPFALDDDYEATILQDGLLLEGEPVESYGGDVSLMLRDWS